MTKLLKVAVAAAALLTQMIGASPAAATIGTDFSECVADHATTQGGFTADHSPGVHRGFAGWPGCVA